VTLATLLLGKFLRGHVRTVPENSPSNLKYVALIVLELLPFNAPKLGGHMTMATPI